MKENKKRSFPWRLLFNIGIGLLTVFLIVFFVFSKDGIVDLARNHVEIIVGWIAAAVAIHLLNIFLDSYIIYLFTKHSCPGLTLGEAIKVGLTGQFYCAVTPGASGGQPMQILAFSRMGIDPGSGTSALIQKFLVWQFTLCAYCIVAVAAKFGFLSQFMNPAMWVLSIAGFAAQVGMIAVLLLASFNQALTTKIAYFFCDLGGKIRLIKDVECKKRKISEVLASFHDNNKKMTGNAPLMIRAYVVTFIQMTAYFLVPYCISRAFGVRYGVFDMLCAEAFVSMVSGLVPLPGASGVTEYCFSVFFSAYFLPQTMKSAILIWRTVTYYGTILLTAPFAGLKKKRQNADTENAEVT